MRRVDLIPSLFIPTLNLVGATEADRHSCLIGRYFRYVQFFQLISVPTPHVGYMSALTIASMPDGVGKWINKMHM